MHLAAPPGWSGAEERGCRGVQVRRRYEIGISDFSPVTCLPGAEVHWNKALLCLGDSDRACREVLFPYELLQVLAALAAAVGARVHHQRSPVDALPEAVNLKVVQELWHNLQGKTRV